MEKFRDLLDLDYPGEYAEQALDILCTKENIVLFGAAEYGKIICNYLVENNISPKYYCDNNENKIGTIWNGLEVISPKKIDETYYVVITCNAYKEIEKQVNSLGCKNVMYFNVNWIRFPKGKREFILNNLGLFENVYDLLQDEKSKRTYINLLNYKITYKQEYTEEIIEPEQYFDDEIYQLPENYNFVDAGSYIGDTVQSLVKRREVPRKIICIDPIKQNIEKLKMYIEQNKYDFVDIYECAISNCRGEVYYDDENSMSARQGNNQGQRVICDSIDNICMKKYPKIHMIKMDIEGSEIEALKGARQIIQRDQPILAICVYHKEDDFYTIPMLIKEIYPEYKLYFRHYELSDEETVCFAIP